MDLDRRFPCVDDMALAARRRMPRFAWEYLVSGIGREAGLARNRSALDAVTFRPRYLADGLTSQPNLRRSLFGREHRSTPLTLRMLAEAAEAKVWIGSRPREDRG